MQPHYDFTRQPSVVASSVLTSPIRAAKRRAAASGQLAGTDAVTANTPGASCSMATRRLQPPAPPVAACGCPAKGPEAGLPESPPSRPPDDPGSGAEREPPAPPAPPQAPSVPVSVKRAASGTHGTPRRAKAACSAPSSRGAASRGASTPNVVRRLPAVHRHVRAASSSRLRGCEVQSAAASTLGPHRP